MNTSRLTDGASRFAHFAGITRGKRGARAEEDDEEQHAEEGDEDEPKGKKSRKARAEDDDRDEPKGKRSSRAEDDESEDEDGPKGKRGSRAEDDDEEDEPQPRGKRSRRAEEDDDEDAEGDDDKEEMNGRSAKASARRREQARIAHILGHSAAANNLPLAVSLACDTRLTRREAVAVLKNQPARAAEEPRSSHDRSRRNASLGNDGGAPTGRQATRSGWAGAFARIGVSPRG